MTDQKRPDDFASAAMMRLVAAGLARQGISYPLDAPSGARFPRPQKRALLDTVLSEHGPLAIFRISEAIDHIPPEPVSTALLSARDTADLLDRWHRLERFSHGRHTVHIERLPGNSFRLSHRSRDHGPPPAFSETMLVLAFIAVLVESIGSEDVTLSTETGKVWRQRRTWNPPDQSYAPVSLILSASSGQPREALQDPLHLGDLVFDIRRRIASDPVRRWTIGDLASETGLSARTLQRRLSEKSTSFSRLVSEARLEVAATLLCEANGPGLPAVGFLSGYSDQAHFTRSFSRAVGTTPSAYRADFAR